jgi:hypothetical protein
VASLDATAQDSEVVDKNGRLLFHTSPACSNEEVHDHEHAQ